ncbi:hypothetical protein [Ktedonospora formicarum]|uniref:hypothetical protein n=1 Tax=Ktedonospora formicarum TaxID=2778364 RepID=UPI001C692BB8|nr:hypothetical protein [Ktedonospora formicarum]
MRRQKEASHSLGKQLPRIRLHLLIRAIASREHHLLTGVDFEDSQKDRTALKL